MFDPLKLQLELEGGQYMKRQCDKISLPIIRALFRQKEHVSAFLFVGG